MGWQECYVTGPNTFFAVIGGIGAGGVLTSTVTLNPTHPVLGSALASRRRAMPHEACAIATGKFPNANLHVNIWPDACDDLVYEIARRVLANFPSGRKVYVEYNNEPWNWAFGTFYFHTGVMGPLVGSVLAYDGRQASGPLRLRAIPGPRHLPHRLRRRSAEAARSWAS